MARLRVIVAAPGADAEESTLVCGDECAVTLGLREIVFRDGPLGTWDQMSPFVLRAQRRCTSMETVVVSQFARSTAIMH